MKTIVKVSLLAVGVTYAALTTGCNPKKKIELRYERPAAVQIPPQVRRLGIAEFGGKTPQDRKWGAIASDRLSAALAEQNRRHKRFELVDRLRLKAILDERDLQLAISDGASAGRAGKLADVHAMIYGTVRATASEERATRQVLDPLRMRTKTVAYTHRHCVVGVHFTMDDIATGKTLATASTSREYDSDKGTSPLSRVSKVMGLGSDAGELDAIVVAMIDECVAEFLSRISTHEVVVVEELQRGKSKVAGTGTKLAAAGDYAEALDCYQEGMKQKPDDHEVVFNIGVIHEAMGNLPEAEKFYDRAFRMEPKERYIRARKRVRLERVQ